MIGISNTVTITGVGIFTCERIYVNRTTYVVTSMAEHM